MAEDDGEVDMDFPALDSKEPMSKFGFAKLALVSKPEVIQKGPQAKPSIDITVWVFMPLRKFVVLTTVTVCYITACYSSVQYMKWL